MSDIADVVALVPMDADDAGPATAALLEVYAGLAGDVVTYCEAERKAIVRDTVEHLKNVRDALAPFGKFKEWCEAAGFTYGTVKNTLTRIYGKQPDNELLPARSLSTVKAELAEAVKRAEKVEADYRDVNNELAAAHTLIKRLKVGSKPLPEHWDEAERLWQENQAAQEKYEQWRMAEAQKARQRRESEEKKRAQQSAPRTPAQEARRAEREAAKAEAAKAEAAEQARKYAATQREWRLKVSESHVQGLAERLSDVAWFNLLTADQRQRYAALLPQLIALVEIVQKQLAAPDVAEGGSHDGD